MTIPGGFALVRWLSQPAGEHGEPSRRERSSAFRADSAPGGPDITASRPHEPIVVDLLDAMSRPASHPRHGEDGRVEPDRQPQVVIEPRTWPVRVGRQLLA